MYSRVGLLALALLMACGGEEGDAKGDCSDAADNDKDGLVDCDDNGCEGWSECDATDTSDTDTSDTDTDTDTDTSDTDTDTDTDTSDTDTDTDTSSASCEANGSLTGTVNGTSVSFTSFAWAVTSRGPVMVGFVSGNACTQVATVAPETAPSLTYLEMSIQGGTPEESSTVDIMAPRDRKSVV